MQKSIRWDKINLLVYLIFTLFFGTLFVIGTPMYLGDSFQHLNQFVTREPVYALLVQILRAFSPEHYYELIVLVQCILAIVANSVFLIFLRKEFGLNNRLVVLAGFILLSPHIMTPLASVTHMVLTNSLLSEGITYSLYLFVMKYLLLMINRREIIGKNSMAMLVWAFFVSLVRGQFMVLLLVWFLVAALFVFLQKKYRKLLLLVAMLAVSFVGRGLLVKTYNYCEQGLFVNTASGTAMAAANVLYVSDREDGDNIEDAKLQEIFYQMYDAAYADGKTYQFAPKGLLAQADHFETCHDDLNFDYFSVYARVYIEEKTGITAENFQELMVEQDKVASMLIKELLPQCFGRYVKNYIGAVLVGLIRCVAFVHPLFNIYALCIYIVAFALMLFVWKKDRNSQAALFMLVVFLLIAGNTTGTAFMIQCISRYMLYNLPMFYLAGLMLLKEGWQMRKKAVR